jgi:hypothetical protein
MNITGRLISAMLSLSVPFIAAAGEPAPHVMEMNSIDQNSPLVNKVHKATAQFRDINAALIYEPLPNGSFRLVGVEFIILASVWQGQIPPGSPPTATPALEGHLMNFVAAPNRYGLPAFYELHVWAWTHNPVGSFADWNTQVSCDQQATN